MRTLYLTNLYFLSKVRFRSFMLNYYQTNNGGRFLTMLFLTICFSSFNNQLDAQELRVSGVTGKQLISGTIKSNSSLEPIENATIKIGALKTKTNTEGKFLLNGPFSSDEVTVKHMGFQDTILSILSFSRDLDLLLYPISNQIEEVQVVSTGYQQISKERTTGSFAYVDAKTMQRNPGMNLLSRLSGVTNGLLIDRNTGNPDGISVRGRSTLFSSTRPLIVVDNFPYEGDLDNINPNDVESVTVLKDATAASIWGVRSGNGVIVITTKKAKERLGIDFSSNFLIRKKPDLFTEKFMTSSDFIDAEIGLFDQGYYNKDINVEHKDISPVVSLLEKVRLGEITSEEGKRQIDLYRNHDVRKDLENYFYRNLLQHQQHVSISSATSSVRNILSIGYDNSLSDKVGVDNNRLNIRSSNQWVTLKDRLKLNAEIWYVKNNFNNGNSSGYYPIYPYEKLAENGVSLEASSNSTLRRSYTDDLSLGPLLDWKYRPVDEINGNLSQYKGVDQQLRFQLGLEGQLYRSFKIQLNYLNSNNWLENSTLYDQQSFNARNLINQYSQIDQENGTVIRPIPLGSILNKNISRMESHYGRIQLGWDESLGDRHRVNGILGMEWRQDKNLFEDMGDRYGYNKELESYAEVDIFSFFPIYHTGAYSRISKGGNRIRYMDNNRSMYGLLSYTYAEYLSLTGSIRKDASNIFGVAANQKGIPLWSVGLSYNFQDLIPWNRLDKIKFRMTYGYNGNVDKNTTAFLTSRLDQTINFYGEPSDIIVNPPNSTLRWERVQNINFGIDFSMMDYRIGGSIEYFVKNGKDLLGKSPVAPQTGIAEFYGNVANTSTKGFDMQIWYNWFKNNPFHVRTDLIFNAVNDKITHYFIKPGTNSDLVTSNGIVPIVGNPINSLLLYYSSGLNDKGDPVGLVNGETSVDYSAVVNGMDRESVLLMGSRTPTRFGSVKNTISYRDFEFSLQILYKFGYHLKRPNSFNSNGLINSGFRFSDYEDRWLKPGDEKDTNVPKFTYPADLNREEFYQYSTLLAIDGGSIRLQDVRLAYSLNPFKRFSTTNLQVYLYASNLGLLWRKNSVGVDPNLLSGYRVPVEWSLGTKFNF